MENAIRKLDDTEFKNHNDSAYIRVKSAKGGRGYVPNKSYLPYIFALNNNCITLLLSANIGSITFIIFDSFVAYLSY